MATFPVLSGNPSYPLDPDGEREENAVKTASEFGYVHGRMRYTMTRLFFGLNYPGTLTAADKVLLETLIDIVNTALAFYWTHPNSGITYKARFQAVPRIGWVRPSYWAASFKLLTERRVYRDEWGGDPDLWGGDPDLWGYDS